MIVSFKDEDTKNIFRGTVSHSLPPDIQSTARRKLRLIQSAHTLIDLRSPPGNRLEALKESRAGQHSIRINEQWRICFVWKDGNAEQVEIVDYH